MNEDTNKKPVRSEGKPSHCGDYCDQKVRPLCVFLCFVMLRSHEGQHVWRCTGEEKNVFWWRWVPMSSVWSHETTHTPCINETSGKHYRCIAEYSAMHRGIFSNQSALHRLTVNDVILESATVGDPSAMRRGVMVMS